MSLRPRPPVWVLVAGDDAVGRMALFRVLESGGIQATVVAIDRALDLLNEDAFDLVLFDARSAGPGSQNVIESVEGEAMRRGIPCERVCGDFEPKELRARVLARLQQ